MSVFENGVSVDAAMLDESSEAVAMNAQVPSVNDAAVDHPAILAGDAEMPSNGDIVNENPSNSESDAVDQPRLNVNDNGSGVEPPPEQVDEVDAVNENDTGVSESSGESRKRKLPLPATEGGVLHFFGMAGRQYGVSEDQQSFPLIVESLKDKRIIAVACGKSHNIVLDDTGTVWSFGNNADNALGRPTPDKPFAINAGRVEIGKPVVQVSAGGSHSAALTEDGDVYAWGCFKSYQYKDRTFSTYGLIPEDVANRQSRETPTLISAHLGIQITKISSGENHLVMLGADKNVYSCGSNGYGQLGRQPQKIMRVTRSMGRVSGKPVPEEEFLLRPTLVKLARGPKIENIWTGLYTTFCSKAGPEGIHFAFGLNDCMQCGILNELKDRGIVTYPFRKTHLRDRKWRQVTGGRNHTIGLSQGGQVYTFGSPQYGKLGIGEGIPGRGMVEPIMIFELADKLCSFVAAGSETCHAVTEDGQLYSWGYGKFLQLATGDNEDQFLPVRCLSAKNQPLQGKVLTIDAGDWGVLLTIAMPDSEDEGSGGKVAKIGGD